VYVVQKVQEKMCVSHSLPVSYRLVSISELVSQQHLACVSNLSWSTNQQRAWAKEAELSLPGQRALPRVNLLLIGWLREGRGGEWQLTDSSGSVRCELVSPSPLWLDRPVFLPHWNYIPHDASGQDEDRGYVELIGSPVLLCPGAEQGLAASAGGGAGLVGAVSVSKAAGFLRNSIPELCVTCVCVSGSKNTMKRRRRRLTQESCVCVGQSVCVTALRVCVLRGWRGNNILCVTEQEQTHNDSPLLMDSVRMKRSRVISYQGTVTEVISEGAGLYVIDKKVGLCVAYQPSARRKLRAGDRVELHHVHFLYRPCPDLPPSILCCCLRSTLRVTTFSRAGGSPPSRCCPGDGVLPQVLLQNNTGLDQYLWASHLSSQLSNSLVPGLLKQQCVCLLSWKLMETLWGQRRQGHRDIYTEMLDEPHSCPLTQYHVDPSVPQYLSVSDLLQSLESMSWSSGSLRSLLPPDGSDLTRTQINLALSWSCRTLSSDPQTGDSLRLRPLLLVGVLQLPSQTSQFKQTLQLRDVHTCTHTCTTLCRNTHSLCISVCVSGCLVCVRQFTMVMERFLQSDFPSYQHLDKDGFITSRSCRVYLQFSLEHLHVLSPSVAMVTHLRQKGEGPVGGDSLAFASTVIRVEQKEGVAWRNMGEGITGEEAGLQVGFSVKAAVIGPVVSWGRDPKNKPMMDQEEEPESKEKVLLVFSGVSARWFPILQPGCFYRLVAANTQDLSALIGCGVSVRSGVELHTNATLLVRSDWRFHTLTLSPPVAVCGAYVCFSSELVCFQGLISERITLIKCVCSGVRLTLCDKTGWSLRVYLDLSHTPYPPGLIPGNTVVLSGFQRKLSRSGGVYCSYSPVSSMTVTSLGDSRCAPPPPAPRMHLGQWAVSDEHRCFTGQVKGHVVCFLFLQLQWSCSQCGSLYSQVLRSTTHSASCGSSSSVFQSKAKLVIDDGTGEAHVCFSGGHVQTLLGLADSQWEGLQRALRVRGHITVFPRGQSLVSN
uniref:CST complex subunit CTC1 n=1 Tax=Kryptolebias marmoratus TaxID=37003 RepID=A0A3Q3EZY6_KRYMA